MRHSFGFPALAALCFGATACMSGAPAEPVSVPAPDAMWKVSVSVQGGIAGIDQQFTTDSGSTTLLVVDAVRNTRADVLLTAPQREQLSTLVNATRTLPDVDRRSPGCRDCFSFDMSISAGPAAKPRRVLLDSVTMDESPDARLIEHLVSIGRAGTARTPP
jgi:hypothetical protein